MENKHDYWWKFKKWHNHYDINLKLTIFIAISSSLNYLLFERYTYFCKSDLFQLHLICNFVQKTIHINLILMTEMCVCITIITSCDGGICIELISIMSYWRHLIFFFFFPPSWKLSLEWTWILDVILLTTNVSFVIFLSVYIVSLTAVDGKYVRTILIITHWY